MSAADQYWYNTRTGEVETGHQSSWTHLLGPYATRAEAEQALTRAKSRNEDWEDDDAEWGGTK
ncbi:SPOR domain-containing protein [Myceligenerans crystallogenes]